MATSPCLNQYQFIGVTSRDIMLRHDKCASNPGGEIAHTLDMGRKDTLRRTFQATLTRIWHGYCFIIVRSQLLALKGCLPKLLAECLVIIGCCFSISQSRPSILLKHFCWKHFSVTNANALRWPIYAPIMWGITIYHGGVVLSAL